MQRFLVRWFVTGLAIYLCAELFDLIWLGSTGALIVASLVLGLLNAVVRPILVILTLPITLLTLGLFLLVVNGITLWLADVLVPSFGVQGSYILTALVITIISWLINAVIRTDERRLPR